MSISKRGRRPSLMLSHHPNNIYSPDPMLVPRFATTSPIVAFISAHHLLNAQSFPFTSSNLKSRCYPPGDQSPLLRIPKHYGHPSKSKHPEEIQADQ